MAQIQDHEAVPFSTQSTASAKMDLIKRGVRALFSAYRRDDFADPDVFLVQIGTVLEAYSEEVILSVTHPRTGVQRRCKFPPSIAEVVEACEAEAVRIATIERYRDMGTPEYRLPPPPPRRDQNFDEMVQAYGRPGHWSEAGTKWERFVGRKPETEKQQFRQFTHEELLQIYSRKGVA